jgi:MerR family transcriptional regulator, light-induced transcriptional regulator
MSAERCAARLIAEKEGLALAIADALYRERPDLTAKYGEAGRAKCVQDMRYNVEHLAPAVALEDPSMFAGYARWLASLLTARGIPVGEIERSIALTKAEIGSRFPADEAAAALPALDAAMAVLSSSARP